MLLPATGDECLVFSRIYIHEIMEHMLLCVWLLSRHVTFSRTTHVVWCAPVLLGRVSLFRRLDRPDSVTPFTCDRHWGCFQSRCVFSCVLVHCESPPMARAFHRIRDLSDLFPAVHLAPSSGPGSQWVFTTDLWDELVPQHIRLYSSPSLALRGGERATGVKDALPQNIAPSILNIFG